MTVRFYESYKLIRELFKTPGAVHYGKKLTTVTGNVGMIRYCGNYKHLRYGQSVSISGNVNIYYHLGNAKFSVMEIKARRSGL